MTMTHSNNSMDWDKLKVFHAAAEAGSFTHAGERLGLSQSAVSRQVSALETDLNVSLFHRHARGLILTEQGDLLYRTAREVFAKLAMTEAMLSGGGTHSPKATESPTIAISARPSGQMPVGLGKPRSSVRNVNVGPVGLPLSSMRCTAMVVGCVPVRVK